MKKLSLSFILIFALAGCGEGVADKQTDTQESDLKLSPIVDKALSVWKKSDEETNMEAYFG